MPHFWRSSAHLLWVFIREVFYALPGVVAFCVAAFSVAVIYMNELQESLREKKAKRWFVAIVFMLLGCLAFVSDFLQRGQERAAIARERESGDRDRRMLIQQNGQLIAFAQSGATHDDIQEMTKETVTAIKGIIPMPKAPAPTVEQTHFTSRRAPSSNPEYPYGLQIIIQSDIEISPVSFAITCTGAVGTVQAFITGQGAYMNVYEGPDHKNADVAIVHFTFPPLEPQTPLVVTILSKINIGVKQISRMPQ